MEKTHSRRTPTKVNDPGFEEPCFSDTITYFNLPAFIREDQSNNFSFEENEFSNSQSTAISSSPPSSSSSYHSPVFPVTPLLCTDSFDAEPPVIYPIIQASICSQNENYTTNSDFKSQPQPSISVDFMCSFGLNYASKKNKKMQALIIYQFQIRNTKQVIGLVPGSYFLSLEYYPSNKKRTLYMHTREQDRKQIKLDKHAQVPGLLSPTQSRLDFLDKDGFAYLLDSLDGAKRRPVGHPFLVGFGRETILPLLEKFSELNPDLLSFIASPNLITSSTGSANTPNYPITTKRNTLNKKNHNNNNNNSDKNEK